MRRTAPSSKPTSGDDDRDDGYAWSRSSADAFALTAAAIGACGGLGICAFSLCDRREQATAAALQVARGAARRSSRRGPVVDTTHPTTGGGVARVTRCLVTRSGCRGMARRATRCAASSKETAAPKAFHSNERRVTHRWSRSGARAPGGGDRGGPRVVAAPARAPRRARAQPHWLERRTRRPRHVHAAARGPRRRRRRARRRPIPRQRRRGGGQGERTRSDDASYEDMVS